MQQNKLTPIYKITKVAKEVSLDFSNDCFHCDVFFSKSKGWNAEFSIDMDKISKTSPIWNLLWRSSTQAQEYIKKFKNVGYFLQLPEDFNQFWPTYQPGQKHWKIHSKIQEFEYINDRDRVERLIKKFCRLLIDFIDEINNVGTPYSVSVPDDFIYTELAPLPEISEKEKIKLAKIMQENSISFDTVLKTLTPVITLPPIIQVTLPEASRATRNS